MKKYLLLLIIFLFPFKILANDNVNIYIFHSYMCSHCQEALSYFESIESEQNITLYEFEIVKSENAYNRNLYDKVVKLFNINSGSVPLIIIGNDYQIGFSSSDKEEIQKKINYYLNNNYYDITGVELEIVDPNNYEKLTYEDKEYKLTIPIINKTINLKNFSLPVITIIMGLVDGFNPCAMWILLFLISLLFTLKDKKKMWILGSLFILTSATIYLGFMNSFIKVTDYINKVTILQIIVGIIAIIFGLTNIKNYIKERKSSDGCNTIPKEKRKFIFSKIKKIVYSKSFIISCIGIIILAALVNLIELLCSLGLPVMFTEILTLNNLKPNVYNIYIYLYIFFFMLDDLIVFIVSMISYNSFAISTKFNKYSHLFGGIIMFIIGLLLIIDPSLLSLG